MIRNIKYEMEKTLIAFLAALSLIACQTNKPSDPGSEAKLQFHKWSPTPPMGWNSWDAYGPTVVESEVKANADYMAKYLKKYGWEYIVVDIRWYVENDKSGGYNEDDPIYVLDDYGRLIPALNRFLRDSARGSGICMALLQENPGYRNTIIPCFSYMLHGILIL